MLSAPAAPTWGRSQRLHHRPMEGNRGDPQKHVAGPAGKPGNAGVTMTHTEAVMSSGSIWTEAVWSKGFPRERGDRHEAWDWLVGSLCLSWDCGRVSPAVGCGGPADPASAQKPWRALQRQIKGNRVLRKLYTRKHAYFRVKNSHHLVAGSINNETHLQTLGSAFSTSVCLNHGVSTHAKGVDVRTRKVSDTGKGFANSITVVGRLGSDRLGRGTGRQGPTCGRNWLALILQSSHRTPKSYQKLSIKTVDFH